MASRNRSTVLTFTFATLALLTLSAALVAEGAAAGRYVVAQCGWHVGQDASWFDSSADKFGRSSYCQTPANVDSFDGVHLINQVKGSTTSVGGTRFSSWRWQAPAGTGIVNVHGQRWQYVRDGFQHRIGGVPQNGSFTPFLELASSDGTKREFWKGFSPYVRAFETRLACRRPSDKTCKADGTVLTGVRALTISIDDPARPSAQIGGALTGSGWLRGTQSLTYSNRDTGSGLRFAQTLVDGALRASSEMGCAKALISGQWRGTKMQPCPTVASGTQTVDTRILSDGPHSLRHCAIDFSGGADCLADRTIRVDNTAPSAPRALSVEGGDGWHRTNGFSLAWVDPPQGSGSPIASSSFRLTGTGGYLGGPWTRTGSGGIQDIQVPGAGEYRVRVWLADLAGNTDEGHSAEATLRLDDEPPAGYFVEPPENDPGLLRVPVSDHFSGIAGGSVTMRRTDGGDWTEVPGRLVSGEDPHLVARVPGNLPRGTWELRAAIVDRAGNVTVTTQRANGSRMTLRTPFLEETAITATVARGDRGGGSSVEVPYGDRVRLSGRLLSAEGTGIGSAELTVTEMALPGSRWSNRKRLVRTGARGFFELWLAPGPGRRIHVAFAGSHRLQGSASPTLEASVGGKLSFRARPVRLRTGKRIRFRGRVLSRGAWQPRRGNLVQIQYFEEAARRWRPVVLARTDRRGRYRSSYRFRYITGLARIRLRALLVPSSRFPYSGAASRPVVIRVRG